MSKLLIAGCVLVVSALQAWDSHVLDAEAGVQLSVLAAIMMLVLAVFLTRDARVRGGAVLVAAAVMVGARYVSDQPMPGLALAAFFPGIIVLLDHVRSLGGRMVPGTEPPAPGRRQ